MEKLETIFYTTIIGIVVVFGAGMYMTGSASHAPAQNATSSANSYNITLVITTNNYLTSVNHNQPAYFVLENGQLTSSAQIYLPSNMLIHLTIVNYDSGPGNVPSTYANVMGTTNGTEFIMNDSAVNITSNSEGQWVTTVPSANLAHTFTVPGMNLNILVPSQSITETTFHTGNSGVFQWQCEVDCGTGASGWGGAMATPGWMMGEVVVQ